MGFLDQAGKKFALVQKKTGDTITAYKLQAQIKNKEAEIRHIYASFGEICYNAHLACKSPEGLDALYDEIDRKNAEIAELQSTLNTLKGVRCCPECAADVDLDARFCPNCGSMMNNESVETTEI